MVEGDIFVFLFISLRNGNALGLQLKRVQRTPLSRRMERTLRLLRLNGTKVIIPGP